ncbi:hypothetical protein [Rhodoferax sp. PAMC 29310]|uniref:hypothetical protein n=1 Tax=Rhodoferax sp. PAMC 29310 TaxID=2822760 RepID=UPI001B321BDD|nr:hypothetical protein [Rhodoferax sp. PAMC 29310]
MSNQNLSSVATNVIATYGITATNVINSYRFGGERLIGIVDDGFATVVNRGASALNKGIRSNLIANQQRLSGYSINGVHFGTDRAQRVIGFAVDLATKGVSVVAANAARIDRAANVTALQTLSRVVMPAAIVVSKVADRIEEGSSELVKRVSGKPMPAKAVATRKLKTATRAATATRKRVVKAATQQVSEAVAESASDVSNAARRVARKAKATAKAA